MRRIIFGIIWFFLIFFTISGLGGAIVGGIAGSKTRDPQQVYLAAQGAGYEFGKNFGGLILLTSLITAVAGSATGILPGTKKKNSL